MISRPGTHGDDMMAATGFLMDAAGGEAINVVTRDMVARNCAP